MKAISAKTQCELHRNCIKEEYAHHERIRWTYHLRGIYRAIGIENVDRKTIESAKRILRNSFRSVLKPSR